MNRKKALDNFNELISDEALVFYIGKYICNELTTIKSNTFLATEDIDYFSIATGMAMTNSKKVYVVVEDAYLLKYFSAFIQAIASGSTNLFFLLLNSATYDVGIQQPTIYNYIRSMKGVMLNVGALIHDYTKYFKTKVTLRKFKKDYARLLGPAVGILEIKDNKLFNTSRELIPIIEDFLYQANAGLVEKTVPEVLEVIDLGDVQKRTL